MNLDFKAYNSFNLKHEMKTTCDMGQLIPVMCKEVIPGDIWRVHANLFMRLIPQLAPFMHTVNAYIHFFYEPCRFVKDNFVKMITKGFSGTDIVSWSYITSPSGGWTKYSLPDYFGLPVGVAGLDVDVMPIRGFWHIYNEWYLNENLQSYVSYSTGDGLDTTTPLTVPYRNWGSDYFTSALPWAQRGNPVYLPLANSAVVGDGKTLGLTDGTNDFGLQKWNSTGNLEPNSNAYNTNVGTTVSTLGTYPANYTTIGVSTDPAKSGLKAVAQSATINDIRVAFQVQRWMEKNAQSGVRWVEYLFSHFGERSSDLRLQRPEYLGGGRSVIVTSEVLQTSSTDSTSPQGNMAGHSFTGQTTMSFTRRFEEFGYVYALLSVLPKTQYQDGIDRMWTRKTSLDYYDPLFSHLGQQGILGKEICATGNSAYDEAVWGFCDRFDELRKAYSKVTADFRDTLDYWTMTRKFDVNNPPQLNSSFVTANDVTKRIFTVTNANPCIVDIGFVINVLRKLPKHGTPGLIDHG